jgi:hypothetical protein
VVPACVGPGCTIGSNQRHDVGAVDAHRAVGNGDIEHFDGAIAKEQLGMAEGVVTGKVFFLNRRPLGPAL